jgi:hypothetical protein
VGPGLDPGNELSTCEREIGADALDADRAWVECGNSA